MFNVLIATPDKSGWVVWVDNQSESSAKFIASELREKGYIARVESM